MSADIVMFDSKLEAVIFPIAWSVWLTKRIYTEFL